MSASGFLLIFGLLYSLISCQDAVPVDGDKTLRLVQVIWRHGDRSPTTTCASDPIQEDAWSFGGGGWGQLSPLGMQMHVSLGAKLRQRYVDSGFLSSRYRTNEVNFRSTDVNRTLLSAVCNTIGMYGQSSAVPGVFDDIPQIAANAYNYTWPALFVPIPVHTVDDDYDYWGNPDSNCPRQAALWQLAQQTAEISHKMAENSTQSILRTLSSHCGKQYDFANLWELVDAFFIERAYNKSNPSWLDDSLYAAAFALNNLAQDFVNGIGLSAVRGFDVGREIRRVRAGPMLSLMHQHILQKRACVSNATTCSRWMQSLKYFVYSAHDTTVYAYLTALNAEKLVIKDNGYPHYSAAVVTEYWTDARGHDFVKFLYHGGFDDGFAVFTGRVGACANFTAYCPLENFASLASDLSYDKWGSPAAMCADTSVGAHTNSAASLRFGSAGLLCLVLLGVLASANK